MLRALYEKADTPEAFAAHVDASFAAMEAALMSLRAYGLVGQDVLLVVASTDPGPSILRRSVTAARRLNSPAVFELWARAQGPC